MTDRDAKDNTDTSPVILRTIAAMRKWRDATQADGQTTGFVPTMGALHAGHLSLIAASKKKNDKTVVSIFVNPSQFDEETDLEEYPRTFDEDLAACAREGVDAVFAPSQTAMYPRRNRTRIEVADLTDGLCGMSRPGHFRGVCTVVLKLLNIVQPARAYFGRKDAQQLFVIRQMVDDLFIDTKIIDCPIVRDEDGLALSSRNQRLTPAMRTEALTAMRAFADGVEQFKSGAGHRPMDIISQIMENIIAATQTVEIDYTQFVRLPDLVETNDVEPGVEYMFAIALFVGDDVTVRLIDNYFVTG